MIVYFLSMGLGAEIQFRSVHNRDLHPNALAPLVFCLISYKFGLLSHAGGSFLGNPYVRITYFQPTTTAKLNDRAMHGNN